MQLKITVDLETIDESIVLEMRERFARFGVTI